MMAEAFAKHDWAYWKEVFDANDVPYAVCNTMDDVLEDDEAYVNDMLRPIHYDSIGDHSITTIPIRMRPGYQPRETRRLRHTRGYGRPGLQRSRSGCPGGSGQRALLRRRGTGETRRPFVRSYARLAVQLTFGADPFPFQAKPFVAKRGEGLLFA